MKHIEKELVEYIVLFVGLLAVFILFVLYRYDFNSLRLIALLGSVFYLFWGIFHHVAADRLNKTIVIEYLVISLMVYLLFHLVLSF
jgi:hypothetical protein